MLLSGALQAASPESGFGSYFTLYAAYYTVGKFEVNSINGLWKNRQLFDRMGKRPFSLKELLSYVNWRREGVKTSSPRLSKG
jgi:hypothetical protein